MVSCEEAGDVDMKIERDEVVKKSLKRDDGSLKFQIPRDVL